jgi:hypothetical protein
MNRYQFNPTSRSFDPHETSRNLGTAACGTMPYRTAGRGHHHRSFAGFAGLAPELGQLDRPKADQNRRTDRARPYEKSDKTEHFRSFQSRFLRVC